MAVSTITLSAATSVVETTATLNGNVTVTGGDNPTVTMYYGLTDGGQTAASWDSNTAPTSPSQPQGVAAFYKSATGLLSGRKYYFSAKAVNSSGTSWPAASLNFTTLIKHYITEGFYATAALPANRMVVVAYDTDSNAIFYADEDTDDIALVGEAVDLFVSRGITTTADAQNVATYREERGRLDCGRGYIITPPNCSIDLYDVITITDTHGDQSAAKYRVLGITTIYDTVTSKYYDKVLLGAA